MPSPVAHLRIVEKCTGRGRGLRGFCEAKDILAMNFDGHSLCPLTLKNLHRKVKLARVATSHRTQQYRATGVTSPTCEPVYYYSMQEIASK